MLDAPFLAFCARSGALLFRTKFGIKTDKPNVEVSRQVTGVRHDAFAQANPLQVEVDKAEKERGYYIHPQLCGAPEEKSMEWANHPEIMKRAKEQYANAAASAKP